jgi:hypothetical protein
VPIDNHILLRSQATERFKNELSAYANFGEVDTIVTSRALPRIKVLRVVTQLLHEHPDLPIERISVDARSGCSDFVGRLVVETAGQKRAFQFLWDCRLRALKEGWTDAFGFPDQIRAAEEFGWQCFMEWRELPLQS